MRNKNVGTSFFRYDTIHAFHGQRGGTDVHFACGYTVRCITCNCMLKIDMMSLLHLLISGCGVSAP